MMIAFDTDVLTGIMLGNTAFVARAAKFPIGEQAVPIIVVEEIFRGRLNVIRQAEAAKARVNLVRAYELFEETFRDFRRLHIPHLKLSRSLMSGGGKGFVSRHTICGSPRSA